MSTLFTTWLAFAEKYNHEQSLIGRFTSNVPLAERNGKSFLVLQLLWSGEEFFVAPDTRSIRVNPQENTLWFSYQGANFTVIFTETTSGVFYLSPNKSPAV